jgi:hypothetical protein
VSLNHPREGHVRLEDCVCDEAVTYRRSLLRELVATKPTVHGGEWSMDACGYCQCATADHEDACPWFRAKRMVDEPCIATDLPTPEEPPATTPSTPREA